MITESDLKRVEDIAREALKKAGDAHIIARETNDKLKNKKIDVEILNNLMLQLNAKLVTSVPSWNGKLGELVIYKNTGTGAYSLYVYVDGSWKSVALS